jgi:CubicO group peptidase (beta-lactamase class C family)
MKRLGLQLTFFIVLVFNFTHLTSQVKYRKDIAEKIAQVEKDIKYNTLEERMAYYKVPGLSIAVIHNYEIEWTKAYGYADVNDKRLVTTSTLFQAASISKSLNGVGVLKLAQDKKIDLDGDINKYLNTWKFPYGNYGDKISVANLLDHSAGLSVHGFPGYRNGQALPDLEQILDGRGSCATDAVRSEIAPGKYYQYSGGGTMISQAIVCDVTKTPYDKYMEENVLKPLGMDNSFYTQPAPPAKKDLLATAHNNGVPLRGKYHVYPEQAAAGLWTTPTDLAKFIIETQLAVKGKSNKILSQEMTMKQLTPGIENSALGVFIEKKADASYFYHSGVNEGFGSYFYGSLEDGNGVVVMINSGFCPLIKEVIDAVALAYKWKGFVIEDKTYSAFRVRK